MKLLIVIPGYVPAHRYGGPVVSTHEMARQLVKDGIDVTVFTTNADGGGITDVPTGVEVGVDGVKVWYFPVRRPKRFFASPGLAREIRARIREFDAVHINWLYVYPTLVAARECIRQRVPYMVAPRGMLDKSAIKMKGSLKKRVYLRLVERKHVLRSSFVHFTSEGERRNAYAAAWGAQSKVLPLGINISLIDECREVSIDTIFPNLVDKSLVLFLGRINYIKGLDLLAEAWPIVRQSIRDAHLLIVGPEEPGYGTAVKSWFSDEVRRGSVTFAGMLVGMQKNAVLNGCTLCVVPSYLESFGMTIIEAMASRKPVVITDRVNISPEVHAAQAGYVVPCNSEMIAEAIIALLGDTSDAERRGANARQLVERTYAIERAAHTMREALEFVVAEHAREG